MQTPETRHQEIEVKLRCDDLAAFVRAGLQLESETPRHFEDNWLFDTQAQTLSAKAAILRVRSVAGKGTLTYKEKAPLSAPASQFKLRLEIETGVADPESLVALLERLGYRSWFRYQKYRTVYRALLPAGVSLQVMFDETPIGNFVELEGTEDAITQAVTLLGVTPQEYILDSYLALQAAYCQQQGKPFGDMVF